MSCYTVRESKQPQGEDGLPIYEFVCQECKTLVEFLVRKSGDEVQMRCSSCGSAELQRVISRVHSTLQESGGSGRTGTGGAPPPMEKRQCPSGNCSTLTLPGHTRQS
jgi:putative FmdB family regulatory protein